MRNILALALPGALLLNGLAAHAGSGPPAKTNPPKKSTTATKTGAVPAEVKALLASAPKAEAFPNAAKATLLDLSDIQVRPNGSTRTVTRQAVKVFNERGRDEGEVRIPYNAAFEKVTITRARTIKPDGTVMTVKPTEIRDSGIDDGEGYSDARMKSFSLPAVNPGAIIDYEYVTDQFAPEMPGHFWTKWWFQTGSDPVLLSRLRVVAPKTLTLRQDIRNTPIKPVVTNSADGKTTTYVFEMKNVTPIEPEPLMPGPEQVAPHLSLSTLGSWQDIASWYSKLAQGRATADASIKSEVARLIKGKTTPEEKAKAIFYDVEEKTRYVAIELGIGAYQPRPAASVLTNQYGDCKDMATLLVTMLREAGITAHPVLLGAGNKDKVSGDLPSPGAFNHAICLAEINGKQYWLDATAQLAPWGEIPGGDRGVEAFVIRDGKGQFEVIPTEAPDTARMTQNIKLTLNADGSATGTVTVTGSGDADMSLRAAMTFLPPNKLQGFFDQMASSLGSNARVTKYAVSDFKNKDVPVKLTYDVVLPSWANKSGDLLLFKARAEQTAGSGSSPFREETRRMPISTEGGSLTQTNVEVTLPSGFQVLSLPGKSEVASDLGRFERTVENTDGTLKIAVRAVSRKADMPAARYDEVRKYFADYLRALDETIVLKKS